MCRWARGGSNCGATVTSVCRRRSRFDRTASLGAASVPLWLWVSRRISKAAAWFLAMVLTVVAFGCALPLGAGDIYKVGEALIEALK